MWRCIFRLSPAGPDRDSPCSGPHSPWRAALVVLLFLAAFAAAAFAGEPQPGPPHEVWRITSLDWPPYCGPALPGQGTVIRKLRKTLASAGIELRVEFLPWARARAQARGPEYIGFFPAWPEEIGDGFTPSPPVAWSTLAVMTYEGSGLVWQGIDSLFNVKVGLVKTYVYPQEIAKWAEAKPWNYSPAPNDNALAVMLSKKRFQAAITDPKVMQWIAERSGLANIKVLALLGRHPLVLAVHKTPENLRRLGILEDLLRAERERNETRGGQPGPDLEQGK